MLGAHLLFPLNTLEGRITLLTVYSSLVQKNKQKLQCEFTRQVQVLCQVGRISRLENLDVIHMCSVSSWDPIGCNCPLPSSASPGEIPQSNLTLLFISEKEKHQRTFHCQRETSSSPLSVLTVLNGCTKLLEMWHKGAQMQTVLYYPKPLCTAFFLFNPSVPNSSSLNGCQQPPCHFCGNIQYSQSHVSRRQQLQLSLFVWSQK